MGLILCFAISNTTIKGQKIAFKQGVTKELKATDMMRWIGLMNNIRACADEIVLNDIVYAASWKDISGKSIRDDETKSKWNSCNLTWF